MRSMGGQTGWRRWVGAAVVVVAAGGLSAGGCSDAETAIESMPDASVGTTGGAEQSPLDRVDLAVRERVDRLTAIAPLRPLLAPRRHGLAPGRGGFGTPAWRSIPSPDPMSLGAVFPATSDGPLRFSPARAEAWALRAHPVGALVAPGRDDGGRVLWEDAYPATDMIAVSTELSAEWFLVLKDGSAPTTFEWALELGEDLHGPELQPGGEWDFLDGMGEHALRVFPAWAVDARGEKRAVELTIDDQRLALSVDTTGLEFPVVVDPLVSVGVLVWGGNGPTPGRNGPAMAYVPGYGAVMAGGEFSYGGGTYTNAAYLWVNATFSALTTPGWPAFSGPATTWKGAFYSVGGCNGVNCSVELPSASLVNSGGGWGMWCGGGVSASCGITPRSGHALAANATQLLAVGGFTKIDTSPYTATVIENSAGDDRLDVWVAESTDANTAGLTKFPNPNVASGWPIARHSAMLAASPNEILLFGGIGKTGRYLDDTWLWRRSGPHTGTWECICNCWSQATDTRFCDSSPVARSDGGLTWHASPGRFVLFAGFTSIGGANGSGDDIWEFDPGTKRWRLLCGSAYGTPCGVGIKNDSPEMVYDSARRRTLTTAGFSSGYLSFAYEIYLRGNACTSSAQCDGAGSGGTPYCTNGACCDVNDCGVCRSCADPRNDGNPGVCENIPQNQPDPAHACAACDGAGTCKGAPGTNCAAGSACASGYCVNSVCCTVSSCGAGLTCGGTSSPAPGTCLEVPGSACSSPIECASGNCVNQACCTTASCPAGQSCNFGGGVCRLNNGQTCTSGAQCGSGNCVDGYCCNSTCSSPCDTCAAPGVQGTCSFLAAGSTPQSSCGNYLCGGAFAACPSACTQDAGCAATAWCRTSDGTCQPDQAAGGSCATGAQCQSGFCVDGVCCSSACSGTCQACSTGRTGAADGTCMPVLAGSDPDSECASASPDTCGTNGACNGAGACQLHAAGTTCGAPTCAGGALTTRSCNGSGVCDTALSSCGLYACNGTTACYSSCTADTHCATGHYCAAGGACQPKVAGGGACSAANQCTSGFCVDGVCCDTACSGLCQACSAARKGSGASGTCGSIAAGTDPDGECSADTGNACGQTGSCNGSGACALASSGTTCGATTCTAAIQTGQQCNGTGVCQAGTSVPCPTGYLCLNASVCATSCTTDAQCTGAYFCRTSDGTCRPDLANGAACGAATQCQSGNCVDGVCCDSPCSGGCQACTTAKKGAGADGTCGAVAATTDPDGDCASEAASTCGRTGQCDGSGACSLHPPGTVCGSTTCASGQQTGFACDGFGTCRTGSTTACTPFLCADATRCASTCGGDADCVSTAFCATDGTCKVDQANGATCTSGTQCTSGHCVDGVCCAQACNGTCEACSAAAKGSGADGACGPVAAATDPDGECADEGSSGCGRNGTCNGFGQCALYASGTACGSTTCTPNAGGGTQTGYTCNGSGACQGSASTACAPYVCQGAQCGATCVDDGDCIATHHCRLSDGTCQPDLSNGAACSGAGQCVSGSCADGVCCDGTCSGACEACRALLTGLSDGQCGPVTANTDPDGDCAAEAAATCQRTGLCDGTGRCALHPAGTTCGVTTCTGGTQTGQACDGLGACRPGQSTPCSPYVCQGASCGVACGADTDCVATAFCSTSGTCLDDQVAGLSCTSGAQCQSGHCVDGVCCDTACTGSCAACSAAKKGGGNDGECGSVVAGLDPDAECATESPSSCGLDGTCDGAGACSRYAPGTSCGQNTCGGTFGSTLTGQQCDGFGTCVAGATSDCAPFRCLGDSCQSVCTDDTQCVPTAWCDAGSCQPRRGLGGACLVDAACQSGFCVEGTCCNTACDGTCQACLASTKADGSGDGTCGAAAAGQDPHGDCAQDDVSTCGRDGTCDGSGACRLHAAGEVCAPAACVGSVPQESTCNGTGTCLAAALADCSPWACTGGACRSTCVDDGDCAGDGHCAAGTCVPRVGNGSACGAGAECQSGYCVDGVCCDTLCAGQCQACDLPGAPGTCSPVLGAPHGSRAACPGAPGTAPDQLCQARVCDGSRDVTTCVGFVGPDVACRDQACVDGQQTFSAACDGRGSCGAAEGGTVTRRCAPYVCAADGLQCRDDCAADTDCTDGTRCDQNSGQCVAATTCDGDHTLTDPLGNVTDCSPFRCEPTGACIDRCDSTQDCIDGYVCNDDRLCVSPTGGGSAAAADDGGCGCEVPRRGRPLGLPALVGVLLAAAARRRRGRERSAGEPGVRAPGAASPRH